MKTRWIAPIVSGLVLAITTLAPVASANPSAGPSSNGSSSFLSGNSPLLQGVQLTPEQQAQITALRQQTLAEVQKILSPEQLAQVQAALAEGTPLRDIASSINLSDEQRRALASQMQSVRSQASQILTPEQRQQVMQNARSLRQSR